MNMITSLPGNCIQAVAHPTRMTRWQKVAFTTFLGAVTGGVTFGAAFGSGAREITSAGIAAIVTLIVLIATPIFISKSKRLSPDEFLKLNESREQAGIQYEASLLTLNQRDEKNIKVLTREKKLYMKLIKQQINQYRQLDEETILQSESDFISVPSRDTLQKTLDDLSAS